MSSAAIVITSPIANPTAQQLAQAAANIANGVFLNFQNERASMGTPDGAIRLLALALNCLGQALLVINNGTASSVGSVTVNNRYALGATAVIPTTLSI
jgi:hypothetical protein